MQGISAKNFKRLCSFATEKVFLPHCIEAQAASIACFELSESPSGWMLVDDSFVISQPSRSYAVKPVVQLTSVLNPRLVSSSSGSNLSLTKNAVRWLPVVCLNWLFDRVRKIKFRMTVSTATLVLLLLTLVGADGQDIPCRWRSEVMRELTILSKFFINLLCD